MVIVNQGILKIWQDICWLGLVYRVTHGLHRCPLNTALCYPGHRTNFSQGNGNCQDVFPTPFSATCHSRIPNVRVSSSYTLSSAHPVPRIPPTARWFWHFSERLVERTARSAVAPNDQWGLVRETNRRFSRRFMGPSLEGVRELWVRSNCLQLKACLVREIRYRKNFEKLMNFDFDLYRGNIDRFGGIVFA